MLGVRITLNLLCCVGFTFLYADANEIPTNCLPYNNDNSPIPLNVTKLDGTIFNVNNVAKKCRWIVEAPDNLLNPILNYRINAFHFNEIGNCQSRIRITTESRRDDFCGGTTGWEEPRTLNSKFFTIDYRVARENSYFSLSYRFTGTLLTTTSTSTTTLTTHPATTSKAIDATTESTETTEAATTDPTEITTEAATEPTETTTEATTEPTETTTEVTTEPTETTKEASTEPTETTTEVTTNPPETTTAEATTEPTETTTEATTEPSETTTKATTNPPETTTEVTAMPTETTTEAATEPTERVTEVTTNHTEKETETTETTEEVTDDMETTTEESTMPEETDGTKSPSYTTRPDIGGKSQRISDHDRNLIIGLCAAGAGLVVVLTAVGVFIHHFARRPANPASSVSKARISMVTLKKDPPPVGHYVNYAYDEPLPRVN